MFELIYKVIYWLITKIVIPVTEFASKFFLEFLKVELPIVYYGCIYLLIVLGVYILIRIIKRIINYFSRYYEQKIVLYMGETGAGKTSCAVRDAIVWHRKMYKTVRQELFPLYEQLRENGYPLIDVPLESKYKDTFIYSDIDIILNHKYGLKSYDADFSRLGIPTKGIPLKSYYRFGAYLIFDEIPQKADARNWQRFNNKVGAYVNFHRKFYHNLSLIAQQIDDVEKRIRDRVHEIRYMVNLKHYYIPFTNKLIASRWTYYSYTGIGRFEALAKGKRPSLVRNVFGLFTGEGATVTKCHSWFFGNIFNHYDSRKEILYYLNGLNRFELNKQVEFELSRVGAKKFTEQHPVFGDENIKKETNNVRKNAGSDIARRIR